MTGLHLAAYFGIETIVQLLLEKGADVNAADQGGWTPLYQASRIGHIDVVKLLLEKGADVNAADQADGRHYTRPLGSGISTSSSYCSRRGLM